MKLFLIDPFGQKPLLDDKLYDSAFRLLYEELNAAGAELHTYDKGDPGRADLLIFFDHNQELLDRSVAAGVPKGRRVLVLWEVEAVLPGQYRQAVWEQYGRVVTLRQDLAEKYGFERIYYPQVREQAGDLPGFDGRKFLTLINANKYSYVEGELYSLRRRAIDYFEKSPAGGFDLYGAGWNANPFLRHPLGAAEHFKNAVKYGRTGSFLADLLAAPFAQHSADRGTVRDKCAALAGYRFAICFENVATQFSEKLFDTMACGTLPVYKGPAEIKELVPADCYIDFDDFKNFEQLEAFMRGMGREEFERRQAAIKAYLAGEKFARLKPAATMKRLADIFMAAAEAYGGR